MSNGYPAEVASAVETVDLPVHHDGLVLHPVIAAGGHKSAWVVD